MDWDAVGAIAELIGSIAVIATLVYLAAQVRANSMSVQNSTIQTQAAAQSEWSRQLTTNPELFELYRKGHSGKVELSARDLGRFDLVLNQSFTEIQAVYRQYLQGGFDDEVWNANLRTLGATCKTPGGLASWARQKALFDRRFQTEVDRYLESGAS
jgi:hypothetical protein